MLKKQKGFTLIELLVVVVIIGILASVAVPNFMGAQDKAKNSGVQANGHNVQMALEQYAVDNSGTYPATLQTSIFAANANYIAANDYPRSPWNTRQSSANADIAFTVVALNANVGAGTAANPITAATHFGAIVYRVGEGVATNTDRYEIGGNGKKGTNAMRVVNLKNF